MKYLLTLFISIFFFALTYASAPTEFSSVDLGFIVCLLAGVLGVEILIARLFARYRVLQNLILAGFTTTNILYINLVLSDVFLHLPRSAQLLALLLALFILTTFMNMLDEKIRIARLLPALFALATVGVLAQTLLSSALVSEVSIERGKTSAKNIRLVDFKIKPNVYFISFDSLIPKVLLKKNLGLETTPYHDVLDDHFRRFRNFFADRVPTKQSLNSLLALDAGHYSEAELSGTQNYFFPGFIPSPLFEIFKHNGYEITTLFNGLYFGGTKGPYVDNYRINSWNLRNGVCKFIDISGFKVFTFMGYCHLVGSGDAFRLALKALGGRSGIYQPDIEFLIDKMRAGLQKDIPQIFVAYIYSPGHTPTPTFEKQDDKAFDEFRQWYLSRSEKTAVEIKAIITYIAKEDPNAIVYVFGDHGPYLSRGDTFEEDGVFFVQDRFGVYGGIHPRNRCAETFATPYNPDFMTILQGAHLIIRCLSGGKNAFLALEDYRLPESPGIRIPKEKNRYEDYLYE